VRFFDRFTRDEVSAKVWWPLALLGLIALVASVPLANRAADRARSDAATRAAAVSIATLQPLTSSGVSASEVSAAASSIVAADPTLSAVRVWGASHQLLSSSDGADQIGSNEAMNDADIDRALSDGAIWLVTNRTMSGDAGPATYHAYTPIQSAGGGSVVTQFEAADSAILADVHHDWTWFRIVVGLATLFLFGLALLSMREPVARIGAGVPFYAENVPPWLRVLDVDRAIALEQAGDRAKDRLAGLQARLDESERLRLRAEGELQQALTALGTGGRKVEPAMLVPEAAPASRQSPSPEAAAAAVAAAEEKKRARAAAAEEKQRAKAAAAASKAARTVRAEPGPPARPDDVTIADEDLAISATAGASEVDASEAPAVVVVPEQQPAPVAAASSHTGADTDHEARDVLERLVPEPSEQQPVDDTSELRSRLARTAALKKPGSRERQESREDLER
jgi:hypothetical protein